MNILNRLEDEERKSVANISQKFTLLDFGGVLLGSYFVWDGINRPKSNRASIEMMLGAVMIYIHSRRFMTGK